MSVYFFAWIASILYGLEALLAKIVSKHSMANPWLFNFVWHFFILVGTAILALWFGVGIPSHWEYIVLASLSYVLAGTFYVLALYELDISVLSPLFSIRTALAVLAGAIFLGEILTPVQYILIFVIFVGGIFVSLDEKFSLKSFFNKKVGLVILSIIFLVALAVFVKKAVAATNFWDTSLWITLLGQAWLIATIPLFRKDLLKITAKQYGAVITIGTVGTLGTLAANAAYAKNVSIAAVIISLPLSMIVAFLASRLAPNLLEHHSLKIYAVRFVAATVMIVAALNL
jgi:drug/metabolite transporter (DMT)-like permease